MQPGWGALLWFAAIVALIPLALWLLRRTPLGGAGTGAPGAPRTVAVLPLSAQHRLVTVEVGQGAQRQWLVLGVSPQGLRRVHTMAAPDGSDTTAPAPAPAAFAQLLGRLRGDGGGGDAR